eukprot:2253247-Rhodomonas_salina.2
MASSRCAVALRASGRPASHSRVPPCAEHFGGDRCNCPDHQARDATVLGNATQPTRPVVYVQSGGGLVAEVRSRTIGAGKRRRPLTDTTRSHSGDPVVQEWPLVVRQLSRAKITTNDDLQHVHTFRLCCVW